MAAGSGLGGIVTALLPLVGLVTILHGRRKRRQRGAETVDDSFERRQSATQESERRMAAYLAQRGSGGYHAAVDGDEQEIRR